MSRRRVFRVFSVLALVLLLTFAAQSRITSALISQRSLTWYWTDATSVYSTAVGDLNGDGIKEIVAVGSYLDLIRWNAFVTVLNSSTMAPINTLQWFWTNDTQVSSVALGDVNNDSKTEIVVGGSFFDSVRWNAFIVELNGTTLVPLNGLNWFWTNNTQVSSVALGDVNNDNKTEIVAGGSFFDNTRWNAYVVDLNGSSFVPLNGLNWFWTNNTQVSSVALGDVNNDNKTEIVAGGSFFDNTRWNAYVVDLNGSSFVPLNGLNWFWTNNTQVSSVALGDVNNDNKTEIVAGGSFFDNTRWNAYVINLNGTTFAPLNGMNWFWTSDTVVSSLAVGNYSGGNSLDIISCGSYYDGVRNNAHIEDLNGTSLSVISTTSWFVTSATSTNAVAIANFGQGNRIVTGGSSFDLTRDNAQVIIWG